MFHLFSDYQRNYCWAFNIYGDQRKGSMASTPVQFFRDQQDRMPRQTNQLTSRSLGKWHGNSKKLSTLPSPWKRAEQSPWVPWPHHTSALQSPHWGEQQNPKRGQHVRSGLLITSLPTKAPEKAYPPYQAKSLDIGFFKILLKDGGKKEKGSEAQQNCQCVEQCLKEEALQLSQQIFFFLPGADHQGSWEEAISRLPRKVPESFYSCLGAENSSAFSQGNRNTSGQGYSQCTFAINALGQR